LRGCTKPVPFFDSDDVGIEHHEGEPTVTLKRIESFEVEDGSLFGLLKPVVARHHGVVLVDLAVASFPVVELAGGDSQPADEPAGWQLRFISPKVDEIDDLIAMIVSGPASVQIRPRLFLSSTCSPISSARTSFFC
jgi:hypothetical protein